MYRILSLVTWRAAFTGNLCAPVGCVKDSSLRSEITILHGLCRGYSGLILAFGRGWYARRDTGSQNQLRRYDLKNTAWHSQGTDINKGFWAVLPSQSILTSLSISKTIQVFSYLFLWKLLSYQVYHHALSSSPHSRRHAGTSCPYHG